MNKTFKISKKRRIMMQDRIKALLLSIAIIVAVFAAVFILFQEATAEQAGSFTGTWIASGQRQTFDFVEGRDVGTFRLTGHVNLQDDVGEVKDYWAECVGLSDSVTGSSARCVWRSMEGEKAYIVLSGQPLEERVMVTGEFISGTGSLQEIEGTFTFTWSSVFINKNQGIFTGQTKDLKGSYKIP
jgi:hypothetical protein